MKVSSLIELLNSCDPDAYIQLQVKDNVYLFAVERQYPGDEFNKNLVIKVPETALGLSKDEIEQVGTFNENGVIESTDDEKVDDIEILDEEV